MSTYLPTGDGDRGWEGNPSERVPPGLPEDFYKDLTIVGASRRTGQPADERSPVLGVVAVFTPTAEEVGSMPLATPGRLHPLREGEILFVGKPPAPQRLSFNDGTEVEIDRFLLFPLKSQYEDREYPYEAVSRRHLTIEMRPGGVCVLTDFSSNGTYLVRAGRHVSRGPKERGSAEIRGRELLVLGSSRAESDSEVLRPQLEVIPFFRSSDEERGSDSHEM